MTKKTTTSKATKKREPQKQRKTTPWRRQKRQKNGAESYERNDVEIDNERRRRNPRKCDDVESDEKMTSKSRFGRTRMHLALHRPMRSRGRGRPAHLRSAVRTFTKGALGSLGCLGNYLVGVILVLRQVPTLNTNRELGMPWLVRNILLTRNIPCDQVIMSECEVLAWLSVL